MNTNEQKVNTAITDEDAAPIAKQATSKQFIAIIFILSLATKMFLFPILLIQTTGRDAYVAAAVVGAVDLLALAVIIALMYVNKTADLFELLTSVIGKIGAKIVIGMIGLFLFFKLNISVAEILTYYGTNVFTDFDTSLMIIVLLVFFAAVGNHTLRAIMRLNELLVSLIVVCLAVLITIVVMTGFDLANILPAFQSLAAFKSGLFSHVAWLGDFTPLLLFVGRTDVKKHTWAFAGGAGVIGTAVAVFFVLVLSAAFGNVPTLVDSTTNLSNILQCAMGNVYGRIDMFLSILWSISAFIESALCFYAVCRCISFVIGKKAHFVISLAVAVCTYVAQVFALVDPAVFTIVVTSEAVSVITPVMTVLAPLFALVCALIDNRKNERNRYDRNTKETSRI